MPNLPDSTGAIAAPAPPRQAILALDISERLLLLALYLWFIADILPSAATRPANLLLTVSETFTAVLLLVRRPGAMATTSYAWTVAIIGTCAPLLMRPGGEPLVSAWNAGFFMIYGLFISIWAKLYLRRSFGIVAASRGIQRGGPYRLLRHPMYFGYTITQVGAILLNPTIWNALVYGTAFTAMILRMGEEEKILREDPAYRDYAAEVRYRLLPGLY